MDNASYHSVKSEKTPTSASKKAEMQDWLKAQNVQFSSNLKKADLYEIIKQYKPRFQKYRMDEIAKKDGHDILRLPPYHCDLNPEELIWAQIKRYVAVHNKTFNIKDIHKLFDESLEKVTPKDWENACKHVLDIEQSYWKQDHICDIEIPEVVIKLAEDSDYDGDSSDTSDD